MTDFRCFLIVFRWYLRNLSQTDCLIESNILLLILYYYIIQKAIKILIIVGIIVLLGIIFASMYNSLVKLRNNRENAFADIDVQLKQRHDLIPQLVDTVKGYAAHEKQTLEQ